MSKLICDVCGTAYPETATQCPICGCVRPVETVVPIVSTDNNESNDNRTYTYVKGGRFSSSNVKRKNRGQDLPVRKAKKNKKSDNSNKGLLIAVFVLLAAIIAVVAYIVLALFGERLGLIKPDETLPVVTDQVATTTEPTETSTGEVLCVDIVFSKKVITFEREGVSKHLNFTTEPSNTTEEIRFSSSDEKVATVGADGTVLAVGPGEAVITIQCGKAKDTCNVACNFEADPDQTTAPTEAETVTDFKLNSEDFTLFEKGETWDLYNGEVPDDQITWKSSNEKVVTVRNGVVKAVGTGSATVTAEYSGKKFTCAVHCSASVGAYDPDAQVSDEKPYKLSNELGDASIVVGETFSLYLINENGERIDVNWVSANPDICIVEDGVVKGISLGTTMVSVTYEGEEYSCIVRVIVRG